MLGISQKYIFYEKKAQTTLVALAKSFYPRIYNQFFDGKNYRRLLDVLVLKFCNDTHAYKGNSYYHAIYNGQDFVYQVCMLEYDIYKSDNGFKKTKTDAWFAYYGENISNTFLKPYSASDRHAFCPTIDLRELKSIIYQYNIYFENKQNTNKAIRAYNTSSGVSGCNTQNGCDSIGLQRISNENASIIKRNDVHPFPEKSVQKEVEVNKAVPAPIVSSRSQSSKNQNPSPLKENYQDSSSAMTQNIQVRQLNLQKNPRNSTSMLSPEKASLAYMNAENKLITLLNGLTSEKDSFKWYNSLRKQRYSPAMITYLSERGTWRKVDWNVFYYTATMKPKECPRYVVPIGNSIENSQIREWYNIKGTGSRIQIVRLATAKISRYDQAEYVVNEKGIIELS